MIWKKEKIILASKWLVPSAALKYVPKPTATTFAYPSVWFLICGWGPRFHLCCLIIQCCSLFPCLDEDRSRGQQGGQPLWHLSPLPSAAAAGSLAHVALVAPAVFLPNTERIDDDSCLFRYQLSQLVNFDTCLRVRTNYREYSNSLI